MLKVMVAEDEQWIRRGIIKCIDWETHGCRLIAEASDGVKAMQLIELRLPDIVLLDIHMPECDGLQLMQSCQHLANRPKFIIISGYNYFEYARTALSLGAFAYLLKPIKKDEVNRTIRELCKAIMEERELRSNLEHAHKQLSASIPIVREKIMLDLLAGGTDNKTQRDFASFTPYYAVLIIGLDGYLSIRTDSAKSSEARTTILSTIGRILKTYEESTIFERGENCYVIVLGLQTRTEQAHLMIGRLVQQELEAARLSVTVAAGSIIQDVSNIRSSFHEAQMAYREKLVAGGGKLLTFRPNSSVPYFMPEEHIRTLCIAVELSDLRAIRSGIQLIFNYVLRHGAVGYEGVNKLVARIMDAASDVARRYDDVAVRFQPDNLDFIEGLESLTEYMYEILEAISEEIAAGKESSGMKAVAAAVKFIHLHYNEDINLDKLAQHVKLNPNYLSEVFKKEIGVNYIDYIVKLRIDKAKELMELSPWLSVAKVAELVGYENSRYFSSVFVKRTGFKPSEYKQQASLSFGKGLEGGTPCEE
jgi:two-component system response regulator YesN